MSCAFSGHPVILVNMAATLDANSHGRLEPG
jgi:hypothetical protein